MDSREYRLARHWWILALRGVLAVLFGIIAVVDPVAFWWAVVIVFGASALVDGMLSILAAMFGHVPGIRGWELVFRGLLGIAVGIIAVAWPNITDLALYFLIAGWCCVTGAFEIAVGIQIRRLVQGAWLLIVSGILSIALGTVLALFPVAGLVVIAWWVGASAIAYGIMMIALSFWIRGEARHVSGWNYSPHDGHPPGSIGAQ